MIYATLMRDGKNVGIYDTKSGSLLSITYVPEKLKSVQVVSQMEIVAYCEKAVYVLRRNSPTSNGFSIYMRRPIM
jgi:hypothetical protein